MTYAIIIGNRVAQLSETFIEVAAPIECIEVPEGAEVKENYTYAKDDKGNITFTAPPAPKAPEPPPLKDQAQSALQQARTTVYNDYGILNEPTPDAWVTYLKALKAIADGTDTTSTALPTAPAQ